MMLNLKNYLVLNITDKTKNIIWKYLYNLFILGISENELENLASYVIKDDIDDNQIPNIPNMPNMGDLFKNLSKDPKKIEESMKPLQEELEKTHIGKIAQDIVGELNLNNDNGVG